MSANGDQGPFAQMICGNRLHLQHGPIDLLIKAEGAPDQVAAANHQATNCFSTILCDLVRELPALRRPLDPQGRFHGQVAARMAAATSAFQGHFITPMAAVAGAVADHVLAAMLDGRQLDRVYVNNGGDIALFLGPGQNYRIAMGANGESTLTGGVIEIEAGDRINGIATSGWRGRSHSLGIADAVTVLAKNAAIADAAATLIANAVDLPNSPEVERVAACEIDPDSDLGARRVTVNVGTLTDMQIAQALDAGARTANRFIDNGVIAAAALHLSRATWTVPNRVGCKPFLPALAKTKPEFMDA